MTKEVEQRGQNVPQRIWIRPGKFSDTWNHERCEQSGHIVEFVPTSTVESLTAALEGLYALIENGDLVRDVTNDDEFSSFAVQGLRITKALDAARAALNQAKEK